MSLVFGTDRGGEGTKRKEEEGRIWTPHVLQQIEGCPLFRILLGRARRFRGAAAYSRQTFLWTICRSVGLSVGLSSALWKNGRSDPAAVWHHRSDGTRDGARSGVWGSVHGKRYFNLGANLWRAIVTTVS